MPGSILSSRSVSSFLGSDSYVSCCFLKETMPAEGACSQRCSNTVSIPERFDPIIPHASCFFVLSMPEKKSWHFGCDIFMGPLNPFQWGCASYKNHVCNRWAKQLKRTNIYIVVKGCRLIMLCQTDLCSDIFLRYHK